MIPEQYIEKMLAPFQDDIPSGKGRIVNLHSEPYSEKFREGIIEIPAEGYIDLPHSTAKTFLGTYNSPMTNGRGDAMTPKALRLLVNPEWDAERKGQPEKFKAPDGTMFRTEAGMKAYVRKLSGTKETSSEDSDEPIKRRTSSRIR